MAQKTLKLKRVFAWAIYQNLRSTPPKDYPTADEINRTISVFLPAFKQHISDYLRLMKQAEELSLKLSLKEISDAEAKVQTDALNDEWKKYNREHGNDIVEVPFDADEFTTLKTQFNREDWGKKWVVSLEEYGELAESFKAVDKQ